ncbi:MAG: selenide, water dikinase SelD [Planctomycetes bacterium]|nr:selenide, water dikinase SelD [Planctomycetota bacterium]
MTIPLKDCPSGGCGAKIGPGGLARLLAGLPAAGRVDPNVLAGFGGAEDAAVYQVSPDDAIVSTVDFFPPMVADPRRFGRIAAANAMSDVYAMGGRVVIALNLVCFPERWDKAILREILAGGAEKIVEADATLAGGHSINDSGLKYGLAVTGRVHPDRVWRNRGARVGDCLVLTKPLGVGLTLAAAAAEAATSDDVDAAIASMERLNRDAAAAAGFTVHAATDVTGFGLVGHALEMAGDAVTLTIEYDALPCLPRAEYFAEEFYFTAAGQRNRVHAGDRVSVALLSAAAQEVVFDPQTSGGLLLAVPAGEAEALVRAIRQTDPAAAIVGVVDARRPVAVEVV